MESSSKESPPSTYDSIEKPYTFFYFVLISCGTFLYSKDLL